MAVETNQAQRNCILLIDDDFINREVLKNIFASSYCFEEADNGEDGLQLIERCQDRLCAILLDVNMPKMSGIELLQILSQRGIPDKIPVFLITALEELALTQEAYELGVMDVIAKPVTSFVIQRRVGTVIELYRARQTLSETVRGQELQLQENATTIDKLHRDTIEMLAAAIEFRDVESGEHTSRIYNITKYILTHTELGRGFTPDQIENMAIGSIMHDVGKIAVPDVILRKPGKLTSEEYEIMKQHTVKGAELMGQLTQLQSHDSYAYACDIARHHHERWDGKGYPDGLKGDEISIWAQVVSIADVYDALLSDRVYKKALSPEKASRMILNGECGVFNPRLLHCFFRVEPVIRQWYLSGVPQNLANSRGGSTRRAGLEPADNVPVADPAAMANRVDVKLMMDAVRAAYDLVLFGNLTQNRFYMIDYDRFLNHTAGMDGVFDVLIADGASTVPPSHRQQFLEAFSRLNLLKAYEEGKRTVTLEHPQWADDGSEHWMSTSVLLMEDELSGDIMDVTLSHCIDEEYQQREKTKELLSDALSLAERANSAKSDFLSRMSHDIRTPLNAILGMTTIMAAHLHDPEKISQCLTKIGTSSKYLLGLINDILDFAKIESGKITLNELDFSMQDLLTDMESVFNVRAQDKKQRFRLQVSDLVARRYVGDELRMRQILTNLLENAHKYTPEGGFFGLRVSLSRQDNEGDILEFVVEDNGIGIRKEFIEQLYEPFAQDVEAVSRNGVGLGLAITRNLVHLLGGELDVASQPGNGTTFTLSIPFKASSQVERQLNTDMQVLVVDDEADICEYTAHLLGTMGIRTLSAQSGAVAVEMIRERLHTPQAFDVAIVDWQMPEMDGIETVRQIRRIAGRNVLVVVMSAYDWSDIEEEAMAAGVDLFLAKPIFEANLRMALACSDKLRREYARRAFQGEKILLAEDNPLNQEVAKTILEMQNLQVDIAANGQQAVDLFTASPKGTYLAIFMDIMMPVLDGHQAARQIRASQHPDAATIPIYAVTANAFHNDILETKLSGMNGHIAKPVDFNQVTGILHHILETKEE